VDTARSASRRTARQEFGLTQDEIYDAIDAGTLHYRQAAMHGNPWLRLLRREVEALARTSHSDRYVEERQARAELARVSREIKRRRAELAALEERRSKLSSGLGSERLGDRSLASAGLMSDTRSVVSLSRRPSLASLRLTSVRLNGSGSRGFSSDGYSTGESPWYATQAGYNWSGLSMKADLIVTV
jgi:hypothetical protein